MTYFCCFPADANKRGDEEAAKLQAAAEALVPKSSSSQTPVTTPVTPATTTGGQTPASAAAGSVTQVRVLSVHTYLVSDTKTNNRVISDLPGTVIMGRQEQLVAILQLTAGSCCQWSQC